MEKTTTNNLAQGIYQHRFSHQHGFSPETDQALKSLITLPFVTKIVATQIGKGLSLDIDLLQNLIKSPSDYKQLANPLIKLGYNLYATTVLRKQENVLMTFFQ